MERGFCERNPRLKVSQVFQPARRAAETADRLIAAARFTGWAKTRTPYLEFRSQSLAPPQATFFRLLRRLVECFSALSKSEKKFCQDSTKLSVCFTGLHGGEVQGSADLECVASKKDR